MTTQPTGKPMSTTTKPTPKKAPAKTNRSFRLQNFQPDEMIRVEVSQRLEDWFYNNDSPPATVITVLPDSLCLINEEKHIWGAVVQTLITYKTLPPRTHNSRVHFWVTKITAGGQPKYVIHRNQLKFT